VHALPSPEYNQEAVLAAIHPSAGTLGMRVGYWRRRPLGDLAVFSTFARLRPRREAAIGWSRREVTAIGGAPGQTSSRFLRSSSLLVRWSRRLLDGLTGLGVRTCS
jgi:hypothetical protein